MSITRLITLLILIFFSLNVSAQSLSIDEKVVKYQIRGIYNVNSSMFVDSYTPFTNYDHDDYVVSGTLNGCWVDAYYGEPYLNSHESSGFSAAVDGSYAITNDIAIKGTMNASNLSGNVASALFSTVNNDIINKINFTNLTVFSGFGIDYFNNAYFSFPVFLGVYAQYGLLKIKSEQYIYNDSDLGANVNVVAEIDDNVFLYGTAAGAALSVQFFRRLLIIPYYIYLYNINDETVVCAAKYTRSAPGLYLRKEQRVNLGSVSTGVIGLDVTFRFTKTISSTLSVGSLVSSYLPYYNEVIFDGTRVVNLSLSVSYRK